MGRSQIKTIRGRITSWPAITADTGEWFWWLQRIPLFAFQAKNSGHFTARKETRRRGDAYWIASRQFGGQLVKKYIGSQAQVTTPRLEEIADDLRCRRDTWGSSFAERMQKGATDHDQASARVAPPT
jgi:hypothetical protein